MIATPIVFRYLITVICCLVFCSVKAQVFLPLRYIPARYELEALSFNAKNDINYLVDAIEDNEGFIWVSGNKSLYVYDGTKIVHYANNSAEYPLVDGKTVGYESYGMICKDTAGLLYIQERDYNNFICFDPFLRRLKYNFKTPLKQYKGLKLLMSISGKNDRMGVFIDRKANRYTVRPVGSKESTGAVYSDNLNKDDNIIFQFGYGNHWLCHDKQILRVAPDGSTSEMYHLPGVQGVLTAYIDQDHVFFLNKDCTRIYTWNKQANKIIPYLSLPDFPLMPGHTASFLAMGRTKLAVRNEMIYMGNEYCFYVINTRDNTIQDLSEIYRKQPVSKADNELFKILVTRNGSVFILRTNGVLKLQKNKSTDNPFLISFTSYNTDNASYSFRAIAEDEQGAIYASFYNGLMCKKRGNQDFEITALSRKLQSKITSLYSLNYWKNHLLWNNLEYNMKTGHYRFLDGGQRMIHTTQCLDQDTLWYYPWESGKLYRYDLKRKTQQVYDIDKKLGTFGEPVEEINDMIPDHTGNNLWLATKWDGIALLTKEGRLLKQFGPKQLNIKDGLGASVYKLYLAGNQLWYGCADGLGLLDIHTGENRIYNNPYNDDGTLKNREIFSILPDSPGNFYLGTSKGIAYFDTQKRKFHNLPEDDVLASLEFNRASAFKTSDNRYYFGSIGGLYSFRAEDLPFNAGLVNALQPIKMFSVTVFNSKHKKYKYLGVWPESGKELVLTPNENTISINFSVPELDKTVYYSYRIVEQGEDWKEYSLDNRIYLYSLSAGTYTLEIKASTDLNDETARFFTIKIIVQQVWHKLVWVRLLMLVVVVSIVVLIMRWRYREKLRKQQELSNLRMKISMDLHDDVGSILSGLAVQSEMMSHTTTERNKQSLNNISSMSRTAMETMRDIVWAMDNRKDKYENLVDRMRAFAEKNLPARNIEHEFFIEGIVEGQFIAPEIRQSLYLIFKEAISNIIRHSNATKVVVRLVRQKQVLYMSIHDNGTAPLNISSAGMGTDNMKLRAEKIGAAFSISRDNGYLISVKVQLPASDRNS